MEVMNRAEELNQSLETSNVSRTTDTPSIKPIKEKEKNFFGRRLITCSLTKEELTAEKIRELLPQVLFEHNRNAKEIKYLYNYYKGKQPILNKEKKVRADINHKVLENHAFEIVEFKKAYVYGEPVQYVQKGEKDNEVINPAISDLNKFMESEDKSSLDKELAEWQYICGTAFRWAEMDKTNEEDEAPFEISIPDPCRTFAVYSSGIQKELLFTGYISYFSDRIQVDDGSFQINKYRIITVYTDDYMYRYRESFGNYEIMTFELPVDEEWNEIVEAYPLIPKGNRIIEYPLNSARIGLIELVMSGLNALNQIKSNDLDGIDQFVQSLLVFINQEIDVEKFQQLVEAGAIEVFSSDSNRPADVKLLTSQLSHSETKIVTDDIYNNILTICGVPRLNDKPSGGDTGQARLLGEGWTMADERAKQDELSFKKSERQFLKLILKFCKYKNELTDLNISNIDIKFTRNKSDNLLVKTQGLMNMKQAQVPPDVAFTICGLFSDPNDVYIKGKKYFGENFWSVENSNTEAINDDEGNDDNNEENSDLKSKKENQSINIKNPASGDNN